uniref:Uncharacterized protein n=1 Tax=Ditylenchus dipsaci TaxID=166011 RepID=A0A915DSV6_9BILA
MQARSFVDGVGKVDRSTGASTEKRKKKEGVTCSSENLKLNAIVVVMFLLSVAGLASSGLVLNRNWLWNFMNEHVEHADQGIISVPSQTIITIANSENYSGTAPAITWFDAWLELE